MNRGTQENILFPGQFGVKTHPDLNHRPYPRAIGQLDFPGRGRIDPCNNLQQSAFARAVSSNQTKDLAWRHVKAHPFQGPEDLALLAISLVKDTDHLGLYRVGLVMSNGEGLRYVNNL